jgi:hypothetical protein
VAKRGSSGSKVNLSGTIREERVTDSASVGKGGVEKTAEESWSGVPPSDNGNVRWSTRFGEGNTKVDKALGLFASSTLKRRRSRWCAET